MTPLYKARLRNLDFAQSAQTDDTEGVEDMSPGLPDSARATPGIDRFNPSLSRDLSAVAPVLRPVRHSLGGGGSSSEGGLAKAEARRLSRHSF